MNRTWRSPKFLFPASQRTHPLLALMCADKQMLLTGVVRVGPAFVKTESPLLTPVAL